MTNPSADKPARLLFSQRTRHPCPDCTMPCFGLRCRDCAQKAGTIGTHDASKRRPRSRPVGAPEKPEKPVKAVRKAKGESEPRPPLKRSIAPSVPRDQEERDNRRDAQTAVDLADLSLAIEVGKARGLTRFDVYARSNGSGGTTYGVVPVNDPIPDDARPVFRLWQKPNGQWDENRISFDNRQGVKPSTKP